MGVLVTPNSINVQSGHVLLDPGVNVHKNQERSPSMIVAEIYSW